MSLVLTGTLFTREAKPYTLDNGQSGTSYRARVGVGRAEFVDVKIPATPEALAAVPPTEQIPESGIPVEWEVRVNFGKVQFVGDRLAAASWSSPRPAAVGE